MRRPRNAEQRRIELSDAAIELLAQEGARGVTHLRVDRRLGVADGTTSFYFQTRSALLRAAADRIVQLDVANFTAAMERAKSAEGDRTRSLLAGLAQQAMQTGVEPERSRARARFELFMLAARDPELGAAFEGFMSRFTEISQESVTQLQPPDAPLDRELIEQQGFAVVTFLAGFLFRLANGLPGLASADQLEGYLRAVIAGVAAEHARTEKPG